MRNTNTSRDIANQNMLSNLFHISAVAADVLHEHLTGGHLWFLYRSNPNRLRTQSSIHTSPGYRPSQFPKCRVLSGVTQDVRRSGKSTVALVSCQSLSDHSVPLLVKSTVLPYDAMTVSMVTVLLYHAITLQLRKAIYSIGSCARYVLDDHDLGWTVVNRSSNKSKTKT